LFKSPQINIQGFKYANRKNVNLFSVKACTCQLEKIPLRSALKARRKRKRIEGDNESEKRLKKKPQKNFFKN
jgi:hypothetical protein